MNRGMLESSFVQEMIGGNPSWWNNTSYQGISQLLPSSSASSASSSSLSSSSPSSSSSMCPQYTQESNFLPMTSTGCWQGSEEKLPESWSQFLLGGLIDQEKSSFAAPFQAERAEKYWESPVLVPTPSAAAAAALERERCAERAVACHQSAARCEGLVHAKKHYSSVSQALAASPPKSCVTSSSLGGSMLDFASCKGETKHEVQPDHSYECNSATGSAPKKPKVKASSAQSPLKVRKEKLGDRITALHQLVSPFGKTDTASVLLEAIGYIRFLQSQIEALSVPYLGNEPGKPSQPETGDEVEKDLRSRGLCLVPTSFMMHLGSDNASDYWAPAFGEGFR